MVVYRGFSFSNFIGEYTITNPHSSNYKPELLSDISHDENYQFYTIDASFESCKLTEIYSLKTYSEESIALEFAAIDIKSIQSILKFCQKYGLVCSDRLLNNNTTDYIFFNRTKEEFAPVVPKNERDSISLNIFCSYVIEMQQLLKLLSGINESNYTAIIEALALFSYHSADLHFFINECPSYFDYDNFRSHFNGYIRSNALENLLFQDKIDAYIHELENYIHLHDDFEYEFDYEYDFVLHCEGQELITLFQNLSRIVSIENVSEDGHVTFNHELTNELISQNLNTDRLLLLANSFTINFLNSQLRDIFPEIRYENGEIIGDWQVRDLLSAMYLEIFLSLSPNNKLKKCANPTCNGYFEVGRGDTRKMYCSQRCAMLMAKRKQRERDKLRK